MISGNANQWNIIQVCGVAGAAHAVLWLPVARKVGRSIAKCIFAKALIDLVEATHAGRGFVVLSRTRTVQKICLDVRIGYKVFQNHPSTVVLCSRVVGLPKERNDIADNNTSVGSG